MNFLTVGRFGRRTLGTNKPCLSIFVFTVFVLALTIHTVQAQSTNANQSQQHRKTSGKKGSRPWCLHNCGSTRQERYDLKNKTYSGETIRGPRTIVAYNLNVLRYRYEFNSKVSFSQPQDLWSKLTGIASPQAPSGTPSAPKQGTSTPTGQLAGMAHIKALQKPGAGTLTFSVPKGQSPISANDVALAQKAQKAIDAAHAPINNVKDQTVGIDQSLIDRAKQDLADVDTQSQRANAATLAVALAGQDLLSFLAVIDATSTYDGITRELTGSPESYFAKGLEAQWADLPTVATLERSTVESKSLLSSLKSTFDAAHPSLLAALSVSQRDLENVLEDLDAAQVTLKATPTNSAEQDFIASYVSAVTDKLGEVMAAQLNLSNASKTLDWTINLNSALQTTLASLDPSGDKYKSFQQAQATLVNWQQKMMLLKQALEKPNEPDPFAMEMDGNCDYAFSTTKQTAVKLTAIDQLPDKTAAAPTDVLSITVECASPFTVSAGVAFSAFPNRQFAIQPVATPAGSTTTTNEFVVTSNSSFHPVPIGMVSARLYEPNETFSLHFSFGISGNFQSQSAGGSSAEFLMGPSVALFRTMFLTPGLYIGRRSSLDSGFSVGNPVPSNITTPPLQSAYKPAFGLAITFTKP